MSVQSVFNLLALLFILSGCSDNAQINYYDKSLKNKHLECISYIPESNNTLDLELAKLYKFNKNCQNRLNLSYKSGIVCHSPYNVVRKVNSNFPSAYITLEVRTEFKLRYSYYKDLTGKATISDLKDAFNKLKEDIL